MATLDAIRRALRQGDSPADIPPEKSKGLDPERLKRKRATKYTISTDGFDATLHFGRHNGQSVSDLVKNRDGRGYLNYILSDFGGCDDLKEVIRFCLHSAGYPPKESK